jgi:hypothetical protein
MADYDNNRRKTAELNRPWKHLTIKTQFSSMIETGDKSNCVQTAFKVFTNSTNNNGAKEPKVTLLANIS